MSIGCCKYVAAMAKLFRQLDFRHPLTNDHAAKLKAYGKDLESDVKEALAWITCKSRDDFFAAHQNARGHDWTSAHQTEIGDLAIALTK